jgi:hypothetical protein
VTVRVVNQTAHKLPSGYPEGRRVWLHLEAFDAADELVFASGEYDSDTGVLTHDEQSVVYEIHGGLSPGLAAALGMPAGPSFHFVLNDTVYHDNRIPPRGFTNAAFLAIQSPPVAHGYADGQYWDDVAYELPNTAKSVRVRLYYQSTSKEYVEFLRDENVTNTMGQQLYDAWVTHGRSTPVLMAEATADVNVLTAAPPSVSTQLVLALSAPAPNPFQTRTNFAFTLPAAQAVRVAVYDVRGRLVRQLTDQTLPAQRYELAWDGRDDAGSPLASGTYIIRLQTADRVLTHRTLLVR